MNSAPNIIRQLACTLTFLLVLGVATWNAQAQSPTTIAGRTIQLTISSGSSPFASSGVYRFLPSALDSSYAIVPISGPVSPSTGTHSYTKTGANTASLSLADSLVPGSLTVNCTFTTANSGTYLLTGSSFPGKSQTGTFFLYSGTSPTSLAGYTITVQITSGASPYASNGSYNFLPAASGNTYNVVGISGVANSSGTYSYTRIPTTSGYISYNDSIGGSGFTDTLSFDSSTTGTLFLKKSGGSGYQTGTFTMVAPTAPSISTHPQSQTVTTGSGVTFSVVASGTAPLTYQWRKNTVDIPGATSASYNISSAQSTDAATYSVLVSNIAGSALSSGGVLTVSVPPPPRPTLTAPAWSLANGFGLGSSSQSGASYRVQVSTNLSSWADLTNLVGTGSTIQIRDSSATNRVRRFYRVVSP